MTKTPSKGIRVRSHWNLATARASRKPRRRNTRRLRLSATELFESRCCLAAVAFDTHDIVYSLDEASSVFAADLDGDDDLDAIAASSGGGLSIAWFENTDGKGKFGNPRAITAAANGTLSVNAGDVDGDGDLDVLSASVGKIAWYENTDGKGTFGAQRIITVETAGDVHSYARDLDGDGDIDVLSVSSFFDGVKFDSKIAWHDNSDGKGTFGAQRVITTETDRPKSVYAGDVDGDGDIDVLFASYDKNKIAWYENTDGKGTFGSQHVVTTSGAAPFSVYATDVDADGDLDVLSASPADNKIAWYENTDGKGTFGNQRIITTVASGAVSAYAGDADGDGDLDVLSASQDDGKIAWYENTDGKGTFGNQRVITTEADMARSVYAGDMDGDGDLDVLSASYTDGKIAWYENKDGKGTFGDQQHINTTLADGARSVYAGDVDGDGDFDVLSASQDDGKIAWYENTDGKGTFGTQRVINIADRPTAARQAWSVYAGDVDGDGDLDVLSASYYGYDGKIAWYENTDGKGTFGDQRIITTAASGAVSVYAGDVDGDGDLDVLSASRFDNKIAWYENTDAKGTFGNPHVITTAASGARSVHAVDVDGDGDLDVLSASSYPGKIEWYENTDGKGQFGDQRVITTAVNGAQSVHTGDMDGDGDLDVLSASYYDDKIAWYENADGKGTFGDQRVISTTGDAAVSVYAGDLDGDGDLDVFSASNYDGKIVWYENTDGKATFGDERAITTAALFAFSVYAADVDGDGDLDVLSASAGDDKVAWYENLSNPPTRKIGDANGDGIFNSSDLVAVFQAGEYEDGVSQNSTFEEGDWNGDQEFGTEDLVLAFQDGMYVDAAHPAGDSIAAAVDWLLANSTSPRKSKAFLA